LFRITARTVLELGAELISSDIIAFYELIKNGFDAEARAGIEPERRRGVDVHFSIVLPRHPYLKFQEKIAAAIKAESEEETDEADEADEAEAGYDLETLKSDIVASFLPASPAEVREAYAEVVNGASSFTELSLRLADAQAVCNRITVSDRGSGMSREDLEEAFLVIGTASRKKEVEAALAAGAEKSPYLGEKGIGRLSAMRLGDRLRVMTARTENEKFNVLEIDWRAFGDMDAMLDQIPIEPSIGGDKPEPDWSGTHIIVSGLIEQWTEVRVREMCEREFARLTDPSEDPANRPRIAVHWNVQRLSIPFMPKRLTDAAHARVSGRYEVEDGIPTLTCTVEVLDLGFEHPVEVETVVLGPEDLQGAIVGRDGEIEDQALVTLGPFTFESHWFNRRRLSRVDSTGENQALRDLQEQWSGIRLYRDGFRVFPYGEEEDDWLQLDRTALRRKGYTLNKTQFIGRVNISRAGNPALIDQTNREGLRVTPEQQAFLGVLHYAVQDRLGGFMKHVERQYKDQKIDLADAKSQVATLEQRARSSITQLRRIAGSDGGDAVNDLEQILLELSDFAEKARLRIAQVEQESRQMLDMAGVGLMVEVVAHELARSSENALKALDRLKGKQVPENLRGHLDTLRAEMKSLSKRIRILDPLSVSGRQRREVFALDQLIRDVIEAHQAQFDRHKVVVHSDLGAAPLQVRAVKGMVVQILENLISNSIYWMDMRAERDPAFQPEIRITLERGPPTITFEDNGRGIAPDNSEKVFRPFFSLKEEKRRRGVGLFIAREAATYHGGSLILSDHVDPDTDRLHRFILELPGDAQL
jgi:signal transduction histidine kinase